MPIDFLFCIEDRYIKIKESKGKLTMKVPEFSVNPMLCLEGALKLKFVFLPEGRKPTACTPCTYYFVGFCFPFYFAEIKKGIPFYFSLLEHEDLKKL